MAGKLVVDTSVAVKWYVPEPGAASAARLLGLGDELLAPDFLLAEFANVLWKKLARKELESSEAATILDAFLHTPPIELSPTLPILRPALELATAIRCSVYDALFLALAVAESGKFVTDDDKLVRLVQATPLDPYVISLASF
ncbi:MAG TPA: type II toxin-antitoxin system VapC family toxin [Candidatus Dormibacteraeota bacterium]|jgi:predicted nucleic acid-binding protein